MRHPLRLFVWYNVRLFLRHPLRLLLREADHGPEASDPTTSARNPAIKPAIYRYAGVSGLLLYTLLSIYHRYAAP